MRFRGGFQHLQEAMAGRPVRCHCRLPQASAQRGGGPRGLSGLSQGQRPLPWHALGEAALARTLPQHHRTRTLRSLHQRMHTHQISLCVPVYGLHRGPTWPLLANTPALAHWPHQHYLAQHSPQRHQGQSIALCRGMRMLYNKQQLRGCSTSDKLHNWQALLLLVP